MSVAPLTCDVLPLARSLLRLARNGAYAQHAEGDADTFHVLSPRNAFAGPVALVPRAQIAQAQALGWLTSIGTEGCLALSRQGRRAVKRAISGAAIAEGACHSSAPRKQKSAASNGTPDRAPQRIEGPLLWLRNRKDRTGCPLITQPQYEAGTRFAADYVKAQMQARVTASWSVTAPCLRTGTPGAGVDISDAALAARNRFHAAIDCVGPEMGQLLIDVCCHDIGLESAERARAWPVRSGKVVLDMGLTALARHYGLEPVPPPPESTATPPRPRARRWADPAFTPTLARWERPPGRATSRDAQATASV